MTTSSTFMIAAVALGAAVLVAPIDTGYARNEPKVAVRSGSDSQAGYRYQAPRYPGKPGCHHPFCAGKVRDYRTKPVVRDYRTKTK
jgi:hypothetical protein